MKILCFSISLNTNLILPQKQSWFNKDRQCPGHCYTLRPRWTAFVGLSPREAGEGGGGESHSLGSFLTFFPSFLVSYFWLSYVFVATNRLFSRCSEWGYFLAVVCALLVAVASLGAEHSL